MNIILSAEAREQLMEIYNTIAHHSEISAKKICTSILDEIERLAEFPLIAQIEHNLSDLEFEFRSLVILRKYKAVYFIDGSTLIISMIWNCSMNPQDFRNKALKSLE